MVDSGTSGIGIPPQLYDRVLRAVTRGHDCKDVVCVARPIDSFPVLLFTLAPDNVFPLLPSDYIDCTGVYHIQYLPLSPYN